MPARSKLPEGPERVYEIKLDGYRTQALCDGIATKLLSRNGNNLSLRFPAMVRSLAAAIPSGSILDGELVALDSSGKPSFSLIQNSASSAVSVVRSSSVIYRHLQAPSRKSCKFRDGPSDFKRHPVRIAEVCGQGNLAAVCLATDHTISCLPRPRGGRFAVIRLAPVTAMWCLSLGVI